jgi:hypothetical protein
LFSFINHRKKQAGISTLFSILMIKFSILPDALGNDLNLQPMLLRIFQPMLKPSRKYITAILSIAVILGLLTSCNFTGLQSAPSILPQASPTSPYQQTLVTFTASLTQPLPAGDSIYLVLLDEVTGLAFNPHQYILHADNPLSYSVSLPFTIGMVLKYRYSRQGSTTVNEHLYEDRPVRYRIYHVEGPATVQDIIAQWTDTQYQGDRGRIMGIALDKNTGQPIPNLLVTAGGEQAYTLADGTFLLEGLPAGNHNLVFYAMDGSYNLYQQGAIVAASSTTPVMVSLIPARLVTVIFTIKIPADTPSGAPIRLAGNLYQLGNTFADLSGGVSTLASRMPTLGRMDDGRYMLTLNLPAGTYLEYKYTLGDGLWSSETEMNGAFRLRQLIVPSDALEENDVVDAWLSPGTQPIHFEVSVPNITPQDEHVSIQFNPGFGWLEPLPMWSSAKAVGTTVWNFDLTGPFNNLTSLHYRYCRQEQCGTTDDAETMGADPTGRVVDPTRRPGTVQDVVAKWAWYDGPSQPPGVQGITVTPRNEGFIAGLAFQPAYHPSWGPLLPQAVNDILSLGVNRLILSPTWTFTDSSLPVLEPLPSQDMPWPELVSLVKNTPRTQLTLGLYPIPNFPLPSDQWWQSAPRDFPWWVSFFERYSNFILHHATVASYNAEPLILGGDWLGPALPGGTLADGSPSNVPEDAENRWRDLVRQIRARYSGELSWAISYPGGLDHPPAFLDAFDKVYILWSGPLSSQPGATLEEMQAQAASILDQQIQPFQQQVGKPVVILISYPSIDWGATGCIATQGGGCLDYSLLSPSHPDIPELSLSLEEQANAYNAVLSTINERSWVSGYISMGYYPPAVLQDKSTSIHGKPAAGILWYWSQIFLGR